MATATFGICSSCGEFRQLYFPRWHHYCIECVEIKHRLPLLLLSPLRAHPTRGLLGPNKIQVDRHCPQCTHPLMIEALPANSEDSPIFICPACGHSYPVNYEEEKRLLNL